MSREFTAVIQKDGPWWIGWVREVHGVNAQAKTKKQLIENLQECLNDMLDLNREQSTAMANENAETVAMGV